MDLDDEIPELDLKKYFISVQHEQEICLTSTEGDLINQDAPIQCVLLFYPVIFFGEYIPLKLFVFISNVI